MREWVVSDYHWNHKNILKYCARPYATVHEMHKDLVKRHNALVSNDDVVYILGDLAMIGEGHSAAGLVTWIKSFHGVKHLILGNHDKMKPFWYVEECGVQTVHTALIMPGRASFKGFFGNGRDVVLIHDPAAAQDPSKLWIHGHTHNNCNEGENGEHLCNVSVEVTNYEPVPLEDILNGRRTLSTPSGEGGLNRKP